MLLVMPLTLRRRQRTMRNLATERVTRLRLEQLGQLLRNARPPAAFNRLHGLAEPAIKHFLDRCHAHSFARQAAGHRSYP